MIYLCVGDIDIRDRWHAALGQCEKIIDFVTFDALSKALDEGLPEIVILNLKAPGFGGVAGLPALRRAQPNLNLFFISPAPSDEECLALVRAGARGYDDADMDSNLIPKATAAIRRGEIWVCRRLFSRFVEDSTRPEEPVQLEDCEGLDALTRREKEIAVWVGRGASNKRIAAKLGIKERTVKVHLSSIFSKTGTHDRLQLGLLVTRCLGSGVDSWPDAIQGLG